MNFYLAGRWQRREEFKRYRAELEALGCGCTAHWLDESPITPDIIAAQRDLLQIVESDAVIHFLENEDVGYNTGGRHVEFGVVLGINIAGDRYIHNIIIGPVDKENIFHSIADFSFSNWEEFKKDLKHKQTIASCQNN